MTPPPAREAARTAEAAAAPALPGAVPGALPAVALGLPAMRARVLAALALLPAAAFLLMLLAPPLNHDVAAILNFAERWAAGERLYRDLVDVNPPLIFVLTAIPAWIARLTPLTGVQALLLCVVGLCLLSWRLTLRLRRDRAEGAVERATLDALVPLACVMVAYDAGQREHLMALFAIPYALLAARRAEGVRTPPALALGITFAAALGFALKPHFLAVPLLVEALVLARRGRAGLADPLPWAMGGVWLLYLALLPVLFPEYLGHVVPLVVGYYLDSQGIGLFDVLLTDELGPAALAFACLVPALAWRGAGMPARMLACVAAGGLLSAWVQHKGWGYHVIPALMTMPLVGGLLAARWLDRALAPGRAAVAAPALALGAALLLALVQAREASPWLQIRYAGSPVGELSRVLKREVAGERLLVLAPDIWPVYPALNYARVRSTLRTMNLWLLVGAYPDCPEGAPRYRESWEMSRPEFLVYRTVAEDFARAPPAGVLVAKRSGIPRCGAEEFDPVEYFSRHPAFEATWRRYTRIVHMDAYRLYLRED